MLTHNLNVNNTDYPFSIGYWHSCVGTFDGKLKCFGYNNHGQLGQGHTRDIGEGPNQMGNNLPFINLGTDAGLQLTVKQVSCGGFHSCVILNDNKGAKCWGRNSEGELGLGDALPRGDGPNEMDNNLPFVNLDTGIIPIEVTTGQYHTCFRFDNGKVKCFGNNIDGQLGYGDATNRGTSSADMGHNLLFVDLGTNVEVSLIKTSNFANHNCVILSTPLTDAQRMKCWGRNNFNQLGYGTLFGTDSRGDEANEMGDFLPFVNLGEESRIKTIGLAQESTCAITITNNLKCWGNNSDGILGIGSTASLINAMGTSLQTTTIDEDTNKYSIMVEGGFDHLCFLLNDYISIKCVGANSRGQLGREDTNNRGYSPSTTANTFPAIDLGTETLKIKYIGTGEWFTCIGYADGNIKCFGAGWDGLLGSGNENNIGDEANEMGSKLPFVDLFSSGTGPSKSPTPFPTRKPVSSSSCDGKKKKQCQKDNKCSWETVGNKNQCVEFECSKFISKDECKEDERCVWKKNKCNFA